ncbi:MAG: ATP-binding protein [Pseudomonadota bacterium]
MNSIRWQLLVGLLLAIMGLALLEAAWSYHDTYQETEEIFDAHLAEYARTVYSLLADEASEATESPFVWPVPFESHEVGHPYERKLNFQVWQGSRLLARSVMAPADHPYAPLTPGYRNAQQDAFSWRVFTLPDPSHDLMIQVAERGDVRGEMSDLIARRTLFKSLALIPLTTALIVWLVSRGLAPLGALGQEINRRGSNRLHPLPTKSLPQELRPIVDAINDLLRRLEQALAQERRFTSNAAHELRTPLGLVRLQVEALSRSATDDERTEAQTSLLRGIDRLSRTVTQMLQLARLEQAPEAPTLVSVDLKEIVAAEVADLAPGALAKNQELGLDAPDGSCVLQGRGDALAVMSRNLLDNAIRYTPQGGRIDVSIQDDGPHWLLVIEDNGPGIPEALRQRVWERFFRPPGLDEPGSGLGLSIVRQVLDLHRGKASLARGAEGRGLRVEIRLPRA